MNSSSSGSTLSIKYLFGQVCERKTNIISSIHVCTKLICVKSLRVHLSVADKHCDNEKDFLTLWLFSHWMFPKSSGLFTCRPHTLGERPSEASLGNTKGVHWTAEGQTHPWCGNTENLASNRPGTPSSFSVPHSYWPHFGHYNMPFGQLAHEVPWQLHLFFVHNGNLCLEMAVGSQRQSILRFCLPQSWLSCLEWGGDGNTFWRAPKPFGAMFKSVTVLRLGHRAMKYIRKILIYRWRSRGFQSSACLADFPAARARQVRGTISS